jgi:hypothetical protein
MVLNVDIHIMNNKFFLVTDLWKNFNKNVRFRKGKQIESKEGEGEGIYLSLSLSQTSLLVGRLYISFGRNLRLNKSTLLYISLSRFINNLKSSYFDPRNMFRVNSWQFPISISCHSVLCASSAHFHFYPMDMNVVLGGEFSPLNIL